MISVSSSAPTGDTPAACEARQDSAFAALSRGYAGLFDSAYLRLTAATSSLGEDLSATLRQLTELGESLVDVPFRFTAVMNGYVGDPFASDPQLAFTVDLVGRGRASASFFGLMDDEHGRTFPSGP